MLVHSWNFIDVPWLQQHPECQQQNATDFTADQINELSYGFPDCPSILKDKTHHAVTRRPRLLTDQVQIDGDIRPGWFLDQGFYEVNSDAWVEIPSEKAGWVIHRSSLNRNGVMVVASLYDSGFNGNISATIYVMNPAGIFIEKGARVGQFVMADAETLTLYQGQYQSEKRNNGQEKGN